MSTEQMRQEFETAYLLVINEGEEIELTEEDMRNSRRGDEYTGSIASGAWWAWQASRAAMVIELAVFDDYPASIDAEMRESLRQMLEAAGLKVKP